MQKGNERKIRRSLGNLEVFGRERGNEPDRPMGLIVEETSMVAALSKADCHILLKMLSSAKQGLSANDHEN
jgi:hypothetical protein